MDCPAKVFFIDDDQSACRSWLRYFRDTSYQCHVFSDAKEALERFACGGAELIVTDLLMPGMKGTELLQKIRNLDQDVPVVIVTACVDLDSVIESLRLRATDFIRKPCDPAELQRLIEKTLAGAARNGKIPKSLDPQQGKGARHGIVGDSEVMRHVYRTINKLAKARCNIIVQGESGTGKELAVRAIHNSSPTRDEPFVVIDCGSVTDTLLESELFGHCRGAFTGADRDRMGLLTSARKGTVFLDEIGNISEAMQTKLLRVLQEGTFIPVGSTKIESTQARFIAATNRDLESMVEKGRFRHDLYHRLNVVTLNMPSLQERRQDIPALIKHFSIQFAEKYQRSKKGFSPETLKKLCRREWKGNIRELQNYVERSYIMSEGSLLDMEHDVYDLSIGTKRNGDQVSFAAVTDRGFQQRDLEAIETLHIQRVLESVGGNQSRAADLLGIHRSTLWRRQRQERSQKN